jgi:alkylation response protein AidB-like acyl-CoA dehydrogenase
MSYGRFEIGDAFSAYLSDALPFERRREIAEREGGFSPDLWQELAASGWLELGSPETGLPFAEVASVAEAVGAQQLSGPFTLTSTFVLPLLARCYPGLGAAAAGGTTVVIPVMPRLSVCDGRLAVEALRVASVDEGIQLTASVRGIAYGAVATHVLVPIQDEDGATGLAVIALPASGVAVEAEAAIDLTAPPASVQFDSVVIGSDHVCRAEGVREALVAAVLRYLHAETAEAVGGIGAVLAKTIEYVSKRVQFGVPIGSFQSLKHALANVQVSHELGRGLVFELARSLDDSASDGAADVLAARIFTADAYLRACETAIQCHGGAGFTWEQGLHYWYRAALRLRATPFPIAELRHVAAVIVASHLGIQSAPDQAFAPGEHGLARKGLLSTTGGAIS